MGKLEQVHAVIHGASAAAGLAGAGLAQIPGSDSVVIVPIQTAMIIEVARLQGVAITKAAAAHIILTFSATCLGRKVSQVLVGWIPGFGNAINATTAAGLTEAIGWAAYEYFGD